MHVLVSNHQKIIQWDHVQKDIKEFYVQIVKKDTPERVTMNVLYALILFSIFLDWVQSLLQYVVQLSL